MTDETDELAADQLLDALHLSPHDGVVCKAEMNWLVLIYKKVAKPKLATWRGLPVLYQAGIGRPKALSL